MNKILLILLFGIAVISASAVTYGITYISNTQIINDSNQTGTFAAVMTHRQSVGFNAVNTSASIDERYVSINSHYPRSQLQIWCADTWNQCVNLMVANSTRPNVIWFAHSKIPIDNGTTLNNINKSSLYYTSSIIESPDGTLNIFSYTQPPNYAQYNFIIHPNGFIEIPNGDLQLDSGHLKMKDTSGILRTCTITNGQMLCN